MAAITHHAGRLYTGTAAERGGLDTTPFPSGVMFVEDDTQDMYIWDGVAWQGFGTSIGGVTYLELDSSNDPLTAGLEINAATAAEPVLILQTTDDNATNPVLEIQDSGDAVVFSIAVGGNVIMIDDAWIGIAGDIRIEFDQTDGDIMLHLGDAAGSDQVQILDSGPAVVAYIDSNGNADFLAHLAVGANAAVHAGRTVNVAETTITNNRTTYGVYVDMIRTGGATNQNDRLGGITAFSTMNANGVEIGHLYGLNCHSVLIDGSVGDGATRHMYGGFLTATVTGGTVSGDVYGMNFTTNCTGGTVDGGVYGSYTLVLTSAAMAAISGNVYGAYVHVDTDEDPAGSAYVLYLLDRTNVDYSIYQDGTAPSYLSGLLAVGGTVVALAQVHVDQSSASGSIPVALFDQGDVSEQHILCSMSGTDVDFPAIIQLDVTGTPTLWWDESEDAWVFTNGLAIGDVVGGDLARFSGAGDLTFEGTGGLIFGTMYVPGVDIVVVIGDANPTEVENAAQDGWSAGELNLVTFPGGGTEHYLTIPQAGKYEIVWNMSFHVDTGGAQSVHGGVMIDDVAVRDTGEAHADLANANDSQDIGAPCILDLPNGTEEVSLWVNNDQSNDVHIDHATVTVKLIGGT